MAVPKGFRTNINILNQKIGPERRQEILDGIANQGTFLPRGVSEEDMDQAFVEFLKDDGRVMITIDGERIPVIFLTIQRWTEFTKTWKFTDEYKNIEMPFITVVRRPDIQQGQNQAGLWNIPGNRTYTYMKIPTWDGIRHGIDLYKVPQPTPVDITYEVRIFTNRMKDLNNFNGLIQRAFQSRQCYINVKGHPMPLHLEGIGDESNIENFENRRFYIQMFEMKLLGYLLDENDYEVIPTINRTVMTLELEETKIFNDVIFEPKLVNNDVTFNFVYKARANNQFTFTAQYNVTFNQLVNIENLNRIVITVNNVTIFDGTVLVTPLVFNANDVISIRVYKDFLKIGKFTLIGNTF
jgi:hypothetical protein